MRGTASASQSATPGRKNAVLAISMIEMPNTAVKTYATATSPRTYDNHPDLRMPASRIQ